MNLLNKIIKMKINIQFLSFTIIYFYLFFPLVNNLKDNLNNINENNNINSSDNNNISVIEYLNQNDNYLQECKEENCPKKNGFCQTKNICQCYASYATFHSEKYDNDNPNYKNVTCNYKKKSHWIAFFLELLLPFGTGHYYSLRYSNAIFKFAVFVLSIILTILCTYKSKNNSSRKLVMFGEITKEYENFDETENKNSNLPTLLLCCVGCSYSILIFIDLFGFGLNIYSDGNGVALK